MGLEEARHHIKISNLDLDPPISRVTVHQKNNIQCVTAIINEDTVD